MVHVTSEFLKFVIVLSKVGFIKIKNFSYHIKICIEIYGFIKIVFFLYSRPNLKYEMWPEIFMNLYNVYKPNILHNFAIMFC